jgi:hypothetical protein
MLEFGNKIFSKINSPLLQEDKRESNRSFRRLLLTSGVYVHREKDRGGLSHACRPKADKQEVGTRRGFSEM